MFRVQVRNLVFLAFWYGGCVHLPLHLGLSIIWDNERHRQELRQVNLIFSGSFPFVEVSGSRGK
jgi:hypothetical protein